MLNRSEVHQAYLSGSKLLKFFESHHLMTGIYPPKSNTLQSNGLFSYNPILSEAVKLLEVAAKHDHLFALYELSKLYRRYHSLAFTATSKSANETFKKLMQVIETDCESDSAECAAHAYYVFSKIYEDGYFLEKDIGMAARLLFESARLDNKVASKELAVGKTLEKKLYHALLSNDNSMIKVALKTQPEALALEVLRASVAFVNDSDAKVILNDFLHKNLEPVLGKKSNVVAVARALLFAEPAQESKLRDYLTQINFTNVPVEAVEPLINSLFTCYDEKTVESQQAIMEALYPLLVLHVKRSNEPLSQETLHQCIKLMFAITADSYVQMNSKEIELKDLIDVMNVMKNDELTVQVRTEKIKTILNKYSFSSRQAQMVGPSKRGFYSGHDSFESSNQPDCTIATPGQ